MSPKGEIWFSRIATIALASALLAAIPPTRTEAGPAHVDLELVLAVDASDSVSRTEKLIQREGYVTALRSTEVAAAIMSRGSVALAYVEWAGPRSQKIVVPWTILSDAEDAALFADGLAAAPLSPGFEAPPWESGTSISEALRFAAGMFSAGGDVSRVIDISGDGPENNGGDLSAAHDQVIAAGIVINGLPIIISPDASWGAPLDVYYEDCVIGGPGAFTIAVDDPSLFGMAIRHKLTLEIANAKPQLMQASYHPDIRVVMDSAPRGERSDW